MNNYYIPIYKWGDNKHVTYGTSSGTTLYMNLQDLYGFEPDAVGYYIVSGKVPTQEEFEKQNEN